jgi:hypothetical protein
MSEGERFGERAARRRRRLAKAAGAALLATAALAGCYTYPPAAVAYPPAGPTTFERSWSAAIGAMADQGVQIVQQDRASGTIRGRYAAIDVTGSVLTQADGSVRVAFNTAGATNQDPQLIDRITRSYNARMGR